MDLLLFYLEGRVSLSGSFTDSSTVSFNMGSAFWSNTCVLEGIGYKVFSVETCKQACANEMALLGWCFFCRDKEARNPAV